MNEDELELLHELAEESNDHLNHIEPFILSIEQTKKATDEQINDIFRAVHTIKGGFGYFSIDKITHLAHALENIFSDLRDRKFELNPPLISAVFKGLDILRQMIDGLPNVAHIHTLEVMELIQQAHQNTLQGLRSDSAKTPMSEARPQDDLIFAFDSILPEENLDSNNSLPQEPQVKEIKSEKTPTKTSEDIAPEKSQEKSSSDESIRVKVSLLNKLMDQVGEMVLNRNQLIQWFSNGGINALGPDSSKESLLELEKKISQRIFSLVENQPSLRKNIQNILQEEISAVRPKIRDEVLRHLQQGKNISGILQSLDRNTTSLQEQVMNTRLQPIQNIFSKFPRLVRDISQQLSKDIQLITIGSNVELDRSILEKISDPLIHMLRNSLDHGIELPQVRTERGKKAQGTIELSAYHEGGKVIVKLWDDGGGIALQKVLNKALEKGLIRPDEAANLSPHEIRELLFKPGFSTAAQVSDLSGRGVGMDVVRTNIEALGGQVEIESEEGQWCQTILRLPLTLAIIPSLIVSSGLLKFAIPQIAIDELVRVRARETQEFIVNINGQEALKLRDELLPLLRLSDVLQIQPMFKHPLTGQILPDKRKRFSERRLKTGQSDVDRARILEKDRRASLSALNIIILKSGNSLFGLVVDQVFDNEEIVIKPLSSHFKQISCYAGSSILGDGSVAMILDASGLSRQGKLDFSSITKLNENLLNQQKSALAETQEFLLFNNLGSETFALNLDMIARVEKINKQQLQKIGEHEIYLQGDESIRVIRLEDHLPFPKTKESDEYFLIIPRLIQNPMGILCAQVEDTHRSAAPLEEHIFKTPGIIGTCREENRIFLLLDLYSLFHKIDPEAHEVIQSKPLSGKKILVAEDTAFFRKVICEFLEELGSEIFVGKDGSEAWKLIENGLVPDLLITDLQMPHMNGFELSQHIRAKEVTANIPIILLTSMDQSSLRHRATDIKIDRYEVKLNKEKQLKTILELLKIPGKR